MAKCESCGAPMEGGRCEYCGYVDENYVPTPEELAELKKQKVGGVNENYNQAYEARISEKNRLTDVLLCFFLGYFGVHKFYEGKIGMGLLYLFTLGLFGIGWIIDIILIATGNAKDSTGALIKR